MRRDKPLHWHGEGNQSECIPKLLPMQPLVNKRTMVKSCKVSPLRTIPYQTTHCVGVAKTTKISTYTRHVVAAGVQCQLTCLCQYMLWEVLDTCLGTPDNIVSIPCFAHFRAQSVDNGGFSLPKAQRWEIEQSSSGHAPALAYCSLHPWSHCWTRHNPTQPLDKPHSNCNKCIPQAGHDPPQSTPVSSPFMKPSVHVVPGVNRYADREVSGAAGTGFAHQRSSSGSGGGGRERELRSAISHNFQPCSCKFSVIAFALERPFLDFSSNFWIVMWNDFFHGLAPF